MRSHSSCGHPFRGQFSLELLAAMAAYFALLAALIAAENSAGAGLLSASKTLADRVAAADACLALDFFALDARNTAMRLDRLNGLAANGRTVFVGAENATCLAKIAAEDRIRVEQNAREPA